MLALSVKFQWLSGFSRKPGTRSFLALFRVALSRNVACVIRKRVDPSSKQTSKLPAVRCRSPAELPLGKPGKKVAHEIAI